MLASKTMRPGNWIRFDSYVYRNIIDMFYVIQKNTFREANYDSVITAVNRLGLDYEIVDVLPFVEDFEFNTTRKDVFCFGSLKLARLATKYGWTPGSLANKNHDYRVYSKYYTNNLLNFDSIISEFDDKFDIEPPFFVRPCEDTKVFTGKVFYSIDEWNKFKNWNLTNGYTTTLNTKTRIQVCPAKNIQKEFRFWIVNGQIATASQYRAGNWINYSEVVDDQAYVFCDEMIKLFELASSFVMDICQIDEGYKIVECGCINAAGFYKANMQKLLIALENHYTKLEE